MRTDGFTLVELLVALTLLGVGIGGWVGTSAVALRTVAAADRESSAVAGNLRIAAAVVARGCVVSAAAIGGGTTARVDSLRHAFRVVTVERAYPGASAAPRVATIELAAACP